MLIFLHIPKAAGTALVDSLIGCYPSSQVLLCYGHERRNLLERLPESAVADVQLVCGHQVMGLDEHWPVSARYFTMVRDPLRHFVSMYHYKQRHGEAPYSSLSFASFVRELMAGRIDIDEFGQMIDNIQTRYLNSQTLTFARDPAKNSHTLEPDVSEAFEFLHQRCCAVGVTERYAESLSVLGGQLDLSLPLLQSNSKKGPPPEIPPELPEFLQEYHAQDWLLFRKANARLDADLSNQKCIEPHPANTTLYRWRARFHRMIESARLART